MSTNVYNVLWADDEVDDLSGRYKRRLNDNGIYVVEMAHNGDELKEKLATKAYLFDAVIVDANFNESESNIESERDTSGLSFARTLLVFYPSIPFFLFTQRSDEQLEESFKYTPNFKKEFPRHKRWFKKTAEGELEDMCEAIKIEVDKRNTTSFKVRNRYQNELNAASLINGGEEIVFELLQRDIEGTLDEMVEPFVRIRRTIEKMFAFFEGMKIIPPISKDTNGTARYFLKNEYGVKDKLLGRKPLYKMNRIIMAKPLAQSLEYVVNITQDGAHSKMGLKLDVEKYFMESKDVLLLRSVGTLFIDIIRWFALFMLAHGDPDKNKELWEKVQIS